MATTNINTATTGQLEGVVGVGPAKAAALVAARPFSCWDDVLTVSGVGPALVTKLQAAGFTVAGGAAARGATTSSRSTTAHTDSSHGASLNTATTGQLEGVVGVGPAKAAALVAARPFSCWDDVLTVSGVGPALVTKLQAAGFTVAGGAAHDDEMLSDDDTFADDASVSTVGEGSQLICLCQNVADGRCADLRLTIVAEEIAHEQPSVVLLQESWSDQGKLKESLALYESFSIVDESNSSFKIIVALKKSDWANVQVLTQGLRGRELVVKATSVATDTTYAFASVHCAQEGSGDAQRADGVLTRVYRQAEIRRGVRLPIVAAGDFNDKHMASKMKKFQNMRLKCARVCEVSEGRRENPIDFVVHSEQLDVRTQYYNTTTASSAQLHRTFCDKFKISSSTRHAINRLTADERDFLLNHPALLFEIRS